MTIKHFNEESESLKIPENQNISINKVKSILHK
jgi:hypothetical protein